MPNLCARLLASPPCSLPIQPARWQCRAVPSPVRGTLEGSPCVFPSPLACRAVRADGTQPAVNSTAYFDFFDSSGHGSHTGRLRAGGSLSAPAAAAGCAGSHPAGAPAEASIVTAGDGQATFSGWPVSVLACPSCILQGMRLVPAAAGTVGAVGNNSVGVTGVSWQVGSATFPPASGRCASWGCLEDCPELDFPQSEASRTSSDISACAPPTTQVSLWICAVESPPDANGRQWFYNSALADCYSLCLAQGVRVVSASYGGGGSSAITEAQIEALGQAGALFVAAAGNEASNNDVSEAHPGLFGGHPGRPAWPQLLPARSKTASLHRHRHEAI